MVLKRPWDQKRMFWVFEKKFQFFEIFEWRNWYHFLGKWGKTSKHQNQNLVIISFLENGFDATLSSEKNVLSIWKGNFSDFCKFMSDENETVFWDCETKPSRPSKFKVGH